MSEMTASVDHIRWCAGQFTGSGEAVGAVAGADTAAAVAALAPTFGALGGEFLSVFGQAHRAHAEGLAGLSRVLTGAGEAANTIAAAYEAHEAHRAHGISAAGVAL